VSRVFAGAEPVHIDWVQMIQKGAKKFPEPTTFFGGYKNPIGIEVEVERAPVFKNPALFWTRSSDGSLKIEGAEFISIPLSGRCIDYALEELRPLITEPTCLWSHRTSIHVHLNVNTFTIEQVKLLAALYACFEDLFFFFVEDLRKGNNYCYHLTDINPETLRVGNTDQKYCAFNMGNSIIEHNTVEFRHMHGTGDLKAIRRWIQLIVKLHHYVDQHSCKQIQQQIMSLNYTSAYQQLVSNVFGATARFFDKVDFQTMMEENVFWAKLYLLFGK
jgi:hypothetical protein